MLPVVPAATVWTGAPLTFSKSGADDPADPAHQDRITPNVWITRGTNFGIYNAATEAVFTHFFSPQNTAWSDGDLTNYAALSYVDWNTWAKIQHGGPPTLSASRPWFTWFRTTFTSR